MHEGEILKEETRVFARDRSRGNGILGPVR
jgi:hypothetical protein